VVEGKSSTRICSGYSLDVGRRSSVLLVDDTIGYAGDWRYVDVQLKRKWRRSTVSIKWRKARRRSPGHRYGRRHARSARGQHSTSQDFLCTTGACGRLPMSGRYAVVIDNEWKGEARPQFGWGRSGFLRSLGQARD